MSNDRYAQIRQALAMGTTPGPWECDPDTIRDLLAERDRLAAALEAAQMGLRYAVRVWVLSDEIVWSEGEIDEAVERIIGDAKKEAGNE